MRLQVLLYAVVVGTLMLTNVAAHAGKHGGMVAGTYARQVDQLWAAPTLMASVQALPH